MQTSVIFSSAVRPFTSGRLFFNGLKFYFIYSLPLWFLIFTAVQCCRRKCCISTRRFTLAPYTAAHKHKWRYHFWNGTGRGAVYRWHLAWEFSSLIAVAIKSVEKGPGAYVQNAFGNVLSFVCGTELVASGVEGHCTLYLVYLPLVFFPFFYSKDTCHLTSVRKKKPCVKHEQRGSLLKKNPILKMIRVPF